MPIMLGGGGSVPSNAITSQGTQLLRGNGATPTEVFTLVNEIHTFTGPDEKTKQIDVTNLDSTRREFINGLADSGEVKCTGNWIGNNAQQQGCRSDMYAGTQRHFHLVFADTTLAAFTALVTAVGTKMSVDKQVEFDITLKITGAITWTYAT